MELRMRYLLLSLLLVGLSSAASDYNRSDYAIWQKVPGTCLTTREYVLKRQGTNVKEVNCNIVSGRWTDPYTGKIFTDPKLLDIDHVVSLSYAHNNGGRQWSMLRKARFGNDTSNLLVTDAKVNRSKGDKGPSKWLPRDAYVCDYAKIWLNTQNKYRLLLDKADKLTLDKLKTRCKL